ncbi:MULTISPECIES: carbohydrate kinase family protein [Actinomadura]|uniref:Sugar or nucleoside kinase, ribokinase family n=1 Tax=Actinomadura madurae TaxID=1993 RepID=A0A1I5VSB2_9ACTN|nr:sugar kinase [Actinomadura madurae]MCP9966160.1 sugar kinase [Actinomadura madurae]MCQ0009830.1 sugar kinase [Actinomadura madurae]MCQ0014845.1 sugar kinase [Actinomadura madurae]URM94951.1 sugar kinase [Actinomadura madurae]URN05669.1 sugar kinase [Actinomadura madurae]
MTRVVVVGDLMTDTVARAAYPLAKGSDTPAAVTIHGGGSGANVAAWLAVEGTDAAFVGRRGSDIAGRNRDMELMGYGVDARLVMDQERPTGTCVVMVTHKGDRTMLSDPGANGALLPEDIERCKDLFSQGTHLHLSGYSLINEGSRKAAIHTLDLARKAQMSVSVDGGSSSPLKRMGAEPFLEWTQGARLLVVNAKEAEILTGRDTPAQAAKVLTAWYPQVVIKSGADGALWYTNGRPEPITVSAEPVDKIVDGTGAGDAFVAGLLPPWLDGKQPADALTAGCRLAARAMQHLGARPTLDVVDNQIK